MIGRRFRIVLAPLLAALFVFSAAAWAGEPTDQLKVRVEQVIAVLRDSALKEKKEERRTKIRSIIMKAFDFEAMARSALGAHWNKLKPEQRKEFVDLFSNLVERTYIGKIELYTDETVRYTGERVDKSYATVDTIVSSKKQEVPIRYSLHKKDAGWQVYDVTIEGNRLVRNYRDQFQSILRRSSYEELVKSLRAKQHEG
ncbi:MAG: ABC transporter substrate-binding protein [Candidatus Tectomicrobia bacterium]|uniref:ABC transporter substrate-binding protein n=1 Tax=Tectimicrobiota bacterium TaxID=2528274 RepID=A0A932MLZ4_UNCTE|nr:ABC transporter substrate-binding protein [Candidatus Tectomicrobia bacterium]